MATVQRYLCAFIALSLAANPSRGGPGEPLGRPWTSTSRSERGVGPCRVAELGAGRALTHMIKTEGLSVTEVIDWVRD